MERYVVRLAFWAGFGQAMAITILTLSIGAVMFGALSVNVISAAMGTVVFVAIGVGWGLDRALDAKRRWNSGTW